MHSQPKRSGTLSPLFVEAERLVALTSTELRAASRAMALAYDTDSLSAAESSALLSAHFKLKEVLANGGE